MQGRSLVDMEASGRAALERVCIHSVQLARGQVSRAALLELDDHACLILHQVFALHRNNLDAFTDVSIL